MRIVQYYGSRIESLRGIPIRSFPWRISSRLWTWSHGMSNYSPNTNTNTAIVPQHPHNHIGKDSMVLDDWYDPISLNPPTTPTTAAAVVVVVAVAVAPIVVQFLRYYGNGNNVCTIRRDAEPLMSKLKNTFHWSERIMMMIRRNRIQTIQHGSMIPI